MKRVQISPASHRVQIIGAMSENEVVGVDGKLPWHIPSELAHFKHATERRAIVMGRKTFDSIGRKPLPGRMNIVITSNVPDGGWPEGIIFLNMSQAVDVVATALRDVSIIGGKNIWSAFAGLADEMLLTRVHKHVDEGQHDNVVKFPLNEMVEAGFKLVTATERRQLVGDSDAYSIMQFTKE